MILSTKQLNTNIPNKETQAVILKADNDVDIIKHDSLEDVFSWLDNELDDQKLI